MTKPIDPVLMERIALMLLPYIKSWGDAERSGDPEFDELFNAQGVARFAARKLLLLELSDEVLAKLDEALAVRQPNRV